jgi:hypothetical protein
MDLQTAQDDDLEHNSYEFSPSRSFYFFLTLRSMPSDAIPGVLAAVRVLDDNDVSVFAYRLIAPERLPSSQFLCSLSADDCIISLRACLLIYVVTRGCLIPRDFQLQASLETVHGRDSVIIAGTGHGKTLCIVIPLLLYPGATSITVSPLKRLQMMQVCIISDTPSCRYFIYSCQVKDFLSLGIPSLAINEDTPHSEAIWKVSSSRVFAQ